VNAKQVSISSYSDLLKLSSAIKSVHFRKFVSERLMNRVIQKCNNLKTVHFSKSAFGRCDKRILELLNKKKINYNISRRNSGRPNLIENKLMLSGEILLNLKVNNHM
jgi:hypothetical protein